MNLNLTFYRLEFKRLSYIYIYKGFVIFFYSSNIFSLFFSATENRSLKLTFKEFKANKLICFNYEKQILILVFSCALPLLNCVLFNLFFYPMRLIVCLNFFFAHCSLADSLSILIISFVKPVIFF